MHQTTTKELPEPGRRGDLTVYRASAGSGKTFTLTAEYIARLLDGEAATHRHILAVTFTNKATAEMKERILQELWEAAEGTTEQGEPTAFLQAVMRHLPQTDLPTLRRRASEALHAIVHDYDYFRVETIDSFFQSLLSNLAHELGLSAGFKVDINDGDVIDRAVDRLMADLKERPAVLSWVLDYIKERIDDNKRWDVTKEVKQLARHLMKEKFLLHDEELGKVLDSESRLRDYRNKLRQMKEEAQKVMKQAAAQLDLAIRENGNGYGDFSRGNNLESYLARILNDNPDAPSATVRKYMDGAENWLRAADRKKAGRMEQAKRLRGYLLAVEELREQGAKVINSCSLSLHHINPLRLLNEINREIAAINHENNRFMLAKTPLLFNRLVGSEDASFVFEKAGTELRHVMIDEFQDTSTLQWSNFRHLLVENMAQGNGCLLVGDVKQSIYRFRNGDWSILAGIADEFKDRHFELHDLDTNFRSAECIVDFNNTLFARAALSLNELSGGQTIARLYEDVAQKCCGKQGGRVRISLFPKKKKEADEDGTEIKESPSMLDDLARQIDRLHRLGTPYRDMTILVRNNNMAKEILSSFAECHKEVPLVSDEAFQLSSSPAVQMLVHTLRYLADKTDTIARTYVATNYRNSVLGEDRAWADIIKEGDALLPEAIVKERERLLSLPLYELCERLAALLELEKLKGSTPYLCSFFDQVLAFLDDNASDIRQFLVHWEESLARKAIPAGEVEGIRIMTIHKSKGLAFHTVLVPFCDWPLEKDRLDDMLWCVPPQAPYNEVPLVPIPLSGKTVRQSVYADAYEEEHLQRRIENLNLMYVAFTRARQNLFVWAETKERLLPEPGMGDVLYECLATELEEQEGIYIYEREGATEESVSPETAASSTTSAGENPLKMHPEAEYVELEAFEARVAFRQSNEARDFVADPENEEARQRAEYIGRGKLLHRIFSVIRTAADIDQAIGDLQAGGVIGPETNTEALRRLIEKRLADPTAAAWFDGSWTLYNECAILARTADGKPQVRRPDRVMMREGETVVVDFKFGNRRPEYNEQVREYCELLRRMGHSDVKGYLWYVYAGNIIPVMPLPTLNDTTK